MNKTFFTNRFPIITIFILRAYKNILKRNENKKEKNQHRIKWAKAYGNKKKRGQEIKIYIIGQEESPREKIGKKETKKLKEKMNFNWQSMVNSSIIFIRAKAKNENGK